jgi:release factor glutamine methyltransferase
MSNDYSISAAIDKAARRLREAGVDDPRREAGSLLGFVLGQDRAYLIVNAAKLLSRSEAAQFEEVVDRRARREPFQQITGHQEFYGLDFIVTPDVLIPRPETELLVETAFGFLSAGDPTLRVCDVGVGSGCIVITLLHERPRLRGLALDISPAALAVAVTNAKRLEVADRLELRESDGFAVLQAVPERFLLITANPPYITESDYAGLQPEVRDHEPRLALTPGGDGLSLIRRLLAAAPDFLVPGGHFLMEIGYDQGDAIATMVDRSIWSEFAILPDLQGIPRCVVLRRA